jgi:hypothetical protein
MREVNYVLSSMVSWENAVGDQARRLINWSKKGLIKKKDLRPSVQSLIEQAEAYGLLSRKDVIRLIAKEQFKDLMNSMQIYPGETTKEEALAVYMLTAKESFVDVENSIARYLTYREEYAKEMGEWQGKMERDLSGKPKYPKLQGWERRKQILATRRRLVEKGNRKKFRDWLKDDSRKPKWEEQREEFLSLADGGIVDARNQD